MPIEFDCKGCDRHIRVRDDMAGKRVKCPECEKILTVPDGAEEESPARSSPVRAGKPEPRREAPSRPRDEDDDRPARKRRPDDDEDDRPSRARRDRDEDEKDDRRGRDRRDRDEDDRPNPKKKGKGKKGGGSSMTLYLGIGGGVLGLGLVGLLLWYFLGGSSGGGAVASYVSGNADGFFTMRVADMWKNDKFQQAMTKAKNAMPGRNDPVTEMQEKLGLTPAEIERATVVIDNAQAQSIWVVVETVAPYDQEKLKSKLVGAKESTAEGKKYFVGKTAGDNKPDSAIHFVSSKMFVVTQAPQMLKAIATAAKARVKGPLDDYLSLLGGRSMIGGAFKAPPQVAAMKAQMGDPRAAKFQAMADFTSGSVLLDLGANLEVQATLKFPDDAKSRAAKTAIEEAAKMARGMLLFLPDPKLSEPASKALDSLKADQQGANVSIKLSLDASAIMEAVAGAMGKVRVAAGNMQSMNNMKQILLAMHNFHDTQGHLPTDIIDPKTGKVLLSWRVAILPYLEQKALYDRFKLNEPWNSPNNMPLVQQMPRVFQRNVGMRPGGTSYFRITGANTLFPNFRARPKLSDISDGTSNTIALVDSFRIMLWTQPTDLSISGTQSLKSLLQLDGGNYNIGMYDGSVRKVPPTVSNFSLRNAITPKGGEPPGKDF